MEAFTDLVREAAAAALRQQEAASLSMFPEPKRSYHGVRKHYGKFGAEIRIRDPAAAGSHRVWLGTYTTAQEAAYAYDIAARFVKGDGAKTNFPELPPLPVDLNVTAAIVLEHFEEAKRAREAREMEKRAASLAPPAAPVLAPVPDVLPPAQMQEVIIAPPAPAVHGAPEPAAPAPAPLPKQLKRPASAAPAQRGQVAYLRPRASNTDR